MKWPMVTLDTVLASLEAGSRPPGGTKDVKDGVPSLGGEHLNNNGGFNFTSLKYIPEEHFAIMRKGIVRLHDILVVKDGATTGKTSFVRADFPFEHAAVNEHVFIVRVRPEIIHPAFAFYFLFSKRGQAEIHKDFRGATIGGISRQFPKKVNIPLPPLSEQRRIVEILDQADALRKKRAEADAKAARILPALFYKMFGDPATNPKGWTIKPLSEHGARVRYGLGQPPKGKPHGLPLIRATNISRGTITSENMLFVDPNDVPKSRNAILAAGEVLVVRSGAYTGDVAQVTEEWEGAVAGYDLVITPGEHLTGEFTEAYLLTPFIQNGYFQNLKTRAGQPHLNASQLAATPVPVVPKHLQEEFAKRVKLIRYLRRQGKINTTHLNRLFEVLLHRAFTGDLTAQWREAHMKELLEEMEQQTKALETQSSENNPAEIRPERRVRRRSRRSKETRR